MIPRAPESFPAWENQRLRAELHQVLEEVIDSGCLVLGRQVQCLERELAAHLGVAEVVGLASGSDALEIALRHLGVRAGQHVVVPALCPSAVPSAVMRLGARPLLVDVDAQSLNLDVSALAACLCRPLQPPAAAVIAVHLFGWPVDWSALEALCRKHDVALLEDASQGFGGSWQGRALGTLGRLAAVSFYPTKNLAALGDAGALICQEPEDAESVRRMRQYGWRQRHVSEEFGLNSRLDELQAAFLRLKLSGFEAAMQVRRQLAQLYRRHLQDVPDLKVHAQAGVGQPSWHQFVVRSSKAALIREALAQCGIDGGLSCRVALVDQPTWRSQDCPVASGIAAELVGLPLHPGLSSAEVIHLCAHLRRCLS